MHTPHTEVRSSPFFLQLHRSELQFFLQLQWMTTVVFDNPAPVCGFESFLGSFLLLDLIVDPEAVIEGSS